MLPGIRNSPITQQGGNEALSDIMEKMVALANGVHSDLVALPDDRSLSCENRSRSVSLSQRSAIEPPGRGSVQAEYAVDGA